ncbi:hypothetical protein [Bacillus anthracis]|uniref:Uncharacterized protein n=1 Tax=Bacillus anthracis TaxID=1392 RepID=A0A0J1HXK4_BACAN|nr:hypothetical protein [Bacillus anthracis]KLV18419.1 hypothetical protein ABW01_13685 [Bacillus anthracis]
MTLNIMNTQLQFQSYLEKQSDCRLSIDKNLLEFNKPFNPIDPTNQLGLTISDLIDQFGQLKSFNEVCSEKEVSYKQWVAAVHNLKKIKNDIERKDKPETLIESFHLYKDKYKNEAEPISFALAKVFQQALDQDLSAELSDFQTWFKKEYYKDGEKTEPFHTPIIDLRSGNYSQKPVFVPVVFSNGKK